MSEELEKSIMTQMALSAMNELIDLMRENEPLWIKSLTDERLMIDHEIYNHRHSNHVTTSSLGWIESSKEVEIVSMSATNLVGIFEDPVFNSTLTFFCSFVVIHLNSILVFFYFYRLPASKCLKMSLNI